MIHLLHRMVKALEARVDALQNMANALSALPPRVAALEQWRDQPSEPPTVGEMLTEQAN